MSPSLGERMKAVGGTLLHNKDIWFDTALFAAALGVGFYLTRDVLPLAQKVTLLVAAGGAALCARPFLRDHANSARRTDMGSDDWSEVSDASFGFTYIVKAWRSGTVQMPHDTLRHTEGFYYDDPRDRNTR